MLTSAPRGFSDSESVVKLSVIFPKAGDNFWFKVLRFAIVEENLDLGIYVLSQPSLSRHLFVFILLPDPFSKDFLTIKVTRRLFFNS